MRRTRPDCRVRSSGGIVLIQPLTVRASQWLKAHTQAAPYQWMSGGLVVECRYAVAICTGMSRAGLMIGGGA